VLAAGFTGVFVLVVALALIGSALRSARSGVAGAVVTPSVTPARAVRPTAAPTRAPTDTATRGTGAPAAPSASPEAGDGLRRAVLATVQIIVPVGPRSSSSGSGSVLTPQGHILTNFHVIGDPDTGELYSRAGEIYVAVNPPDARSEPDVRYLADVMEVDRNLDLALLKIRGLTSGRPLPADLGLTVMPVGDSDTVNIGDQLSIIGFPGLGGATVTLTKGSVSGFLTGEGWIKTDAEINSGNSGGAAIDANGALVGIPSEANAERTEVPGKIGLVRPVNLARPLIDLALRDAR
jgi:S1-C subfamily serine protease